ncbi:hypothetical protein HDU97_008041 [Phlyctochytrium planicorne]|nr:hypothetical protein HDU97_008041 [Phlyctochytrium planicorne]
MNKQADCDILDHAFPSLRIRVLGGCDKFPGIKIMHEFLDGAATSRIIEIRWRGMGLEGLLPSSLGHLERLKVLELDSNLLEGPIPEEWSALRSLEHLVLADNSITGQLPPWLGNLSLLKTLDIERNLLSGDIPTSIGTIKSLQSIRLTSNQLSGRLPDSLLSLPNLSNLQASNNLLVGPVPVLDNNCFKESDFSRVLMQRLQNPDVVCVVSPQRDKGCPGKSVPIRDLSFKAGFQVAAALTLQTTNTFSTTNDFNINLPTETTPPSNFLNMPKPQPSQTTTPTTADGTMSSTPSLTVILAGGIPALVIVISIAIFFAVILPYRRRKKLERMAVEEQRRWDEENLEHLRIEREIAQAELEARQMEMERDIQRQLEMERAIYEERQKTRAKTKAAAMEHKVKVQVPKVREIEDYMYHEHEVKERQFRMLWLQQQQLGGLPISPTTATSSSDSSASSTLSRKPNASNPTSPTSPRSEAAVRLLDSVNSHYASSVNSSNTPTLPRITESAGEREHGPDDEEEGEENEDVRRQRALRKGKGKAH